MGALGSAGAAQPQLPGSGEAKEVLVVRTKCRSKGWPGRALVLSSSPLSWETGPVQSSALLLWHLTPLPPHAPCLLDKGTFRHRSGHASDLRV